MTIEVQVDRISLKCLFDALELPETTGYRYLKTLDGILSGQEFWTYQKGDGSVDADGIAIIKVYYELTRQHKVKFCNKHLLKELEKNGYIIQQNQQNRNYRNQSNYSGTATNERQNQQSKPSNFYDSLLGI